MKHLQPGGLLVFSCNLKRFVLDDQLGQDFQVTDIGWWSQSPDFQRKTTHGAYGGHHCFTLEHKLS